MRTLLLPASAAAFAPRSAPTIVLGAKVEPWLTQTLKRISRVKKPLNSVPQHLRCLTETLGSSAAVWTICSLMLPRKPEAELLRDENPFKEALSNFQLIHIEAYVVHVDLVLQHEVAFKLTVESIQTLIDYHKDIYLVDVAADTWDWNEKPAQIKKLHEEFVQAVNRFVYRTHATALEGLEEDGAGELLNGRSNEVKNQIMGLFLPLLPPPPRVVELVRPAPLLPSSANMAAWSQPQYPYQHQHQHQLQLPQLQSQPQQHAPVEAWKIVPSTPSPVMTTAETTQPMWASLSMPEAPTYGLPSPALSFSSTSLPYSQPTTQSSYQPTTQTSYHSQPAFSQPFVTQSLYSAPMAVTYGINTGISAPLPLPSMYPQTCGADVSMGGFEWDGYRSGVY